MKICGIEFLPTWTSFEHWLPSFMVFYFFAGMTGYGLLFILICALLLYFQLRQLYIFPLLYIAWQIYDRHTPKRGGRKRMWFRRLKLWNYLGDYFPVHIINTGEFSSSKNYIIGYHPHGILCVGIVACFNSESKYFKKIFPDITPRVLLMNTMFLQPIAREQLMWAGACSVSKESIDWLLTREGKGNAIIIAVGGAAESLEAHPGSATLVLKNRKGFIKLALKHGASLVPTFAFGENEIFNQVQNPEGSYLRRFQHKFMKIFGFTVPLFYGRGFFPHGFGFMPFRKPITYVIGKPIDLEVDPDPSQAKIDATHQMYIDCLTELFETHKVKYGSNLQLKLK